MHDTRLIYTKVISFLTSNKQVKIEIRNNTIYISNPPPNKSLGRNQIMYKVYMRKTTFCTELPIMDISYKQCHNSIWIFFPVRNVFKVAFSIFTSVATCIISTLFLFMTKWHSIVWIYHVLFISCFYFWLLLIILWIFMCKFLCQHVSNSLTHLCAMYKYVAWDCWVIHSKYVL